MAIVAVVVGLVIVVAQGGSGGTSDPTPAASGTSGSSSSAAVGDALRSPRLGIQLWQNDEAVPLGLERTDDDAPLTVAVLQPEPFEFRFPSLSGGEAMQICAWTTDSIFGITSNGSTMEHTGFRIGTGIADYEFGSGTLYVNNMGHNHWVGDRVTEVSSSEDKYYISEIWEDDTRTPTDEFSGTLYVAAFVDKDDDDVFDVGEYDYLKLEI